jgi:ligand-binding sensor protein
MGKVSLNDIVNLRAFEEAGNLFYRATGMTISFYDETGKVVFYPAEERCELCHLIQSTQIGRERCAASDRQASERALRRKSPISYTCHAGLTDVVVPVVVAGERIGCFYSGQSLLTPQTAMGYQEIRNSVADMGLDPDELWQAYMKSPVVDGSRLEIAMGLLSVISNHLVEGEIALRQERELTREQRKLRRAAEEKARLERDLREMELKLLQAQVNPHFLFNALNLILGQSMAENASETARLIEELSVVLRASLSTIGSMVPLGDEVESARSYLEFFRARFGHKFDITLQVPEEIKSFRVPSLILQPIVENALVHAFPRCRAQFSLKIEASHGHGCVRVRISDNGPGMSPQRVAVLRECLRNRGSDTKLTGLTGVNRRLKYYYPGVKDLEITSSDSGLTVEIVLPNPAQPESPLPRRERAG